MVESNATPNAADACRWVEKIADARPVSASEMVEYVHACNGTKANAMLMPRKNIEALIVHRLVVSEINTNGRLENITNVNPSATNRRGPTVWYNLPTY